MYPDPFKCLALTIVVPNIVCLIEEISIEGARYGTKDCAIVPNDITGKCHLPKTIERNGNKH